ncbi:hypothetical protein GE061_010245 [Apolygus lucorum]|uniref:Uncharacterized protein n=1 Tax=Apolygus lucorum TaxID=248454 RepID=A0A6A4JR92_APOLU|nr:hypothetical protein GE061_010245 [Apolygus lucorum]
MTKPMRRWEPSVPVKPRDNIKSSNYQNYVPFSPSYNKDRVNMYLLLAHDYAKLWKAENKAVEVRRFEFAGEEHERLCRRYVLRNLQKKKKVDDNKPRFIMKRFRNIPSKVRQFMRPQEIVKRAIDAEDCKMKDRLSRTRDSTDMVREKLMKNSAEDVPLGFDLFNVTLSPDVLECTSNLDVVSRTSKHEDLSTLEVTPRISDNPMEGHIHVSSDGMRMHVNSLPLDSHRHKCKLLARPCQ